MFELRDILIAALEEAGLTARCAPDGEPVIRPGKTVCTVELEESDVTDTAFGQYLGTLEHPEHGPLPLFGRRFRTRAALRLFSPDGPEACDGAVQTALDALLRLQGLRAGELHLDKADWDDAAGAFTRCVTVQLQGMLYCLQTDEGAAFTDFTLVPTII